MVLITGCSSGIGLHLALRLAADPSRSFKGRGGGGRGAALVPGHLGNLSRTFRPSSCPHPPVYATLRDLSAQGPLWEAAGSHGCPPGSLKTLQLDVQDAESVAAARAHVTEGRVDVLGEPPLSCVQTRVS